MHGAWWCDFGGSGDRSGEIMIVNLAWLVLVGRSLKSDLCWLFVAGENEF